jgi:hypothetical protein
MSTQRPQDGSNRKDAEWPDPSSSRHGILGYTNSLEGMFDSGSPSNLRPLILDPSRGTVVNEQDTAGQRNQNQQGIKIKTAAETHANN